jgi:hypothetical protein
MISSTPNATMSPARGTEIANSRHAIELLLIRMESLHLDASEWRRIAPLVAREMAARCTSCQCKETCERDLAYDSAGMVAREWESYCPNAKVLRAMCALPWFADGGRS